MDRVQPHLNCNREKDRCQHHHRRRRVHKAAHKQQQDDNEQKDNRCAFADPQNTVCDEVGNSIDRQQLGKCCRTGYNHEDGAGRHTAVGKCSVDVLRRQLPMDKHAAEKCISCGNRRSLRGCKDPSVDTAQDYDGADERPLGIPDLTQFLLCGIAALITLPAILLGDEIACDDERDSDQDPRQDSCHKYRADRGSRRCSIDNHGNARRDDDADAARTGDQTERKLLVIPFLEHGGQYHRSDGGNRRGPRAGYCGKEHAQHNGDDRKPTGETSKEYIGDIEQSPRYASDRHQLTREDEERDRDESKRVRGCHHLLYNIEIAEAPIRKDRHHRRETNGKANGHIQKEPNKEHAEQNNCHFHRRSLLSCACLHITRTCICAECRNVFEYVLDLTNDNQPKAHGRRSIDNSHRKPQRRRVLAIVQLKLCELKSGDQDIDGQRQHEQLAKDHDIGAQRLGIEEQCRLDLDVLCITRPVPSPQIDEPDEAVPCQLL